MLIKLSLPLILLIAFACTDPAWSDSAKLLGKTGEWESFSYTDKSGKVCYTASLPKHTLNAPKGRAESHLSITDRVADKSVGVISVAEGFPTTKDGEIDIGGAKFDLYASDNALWSRADKAVVQTMLKGKSLLVYGAPPKGAQVVDTYSLDGFAKAYADIGKACGLH